MITPHIVTGPRLPCASPGDVKRVRERYRQAFGRYPNLLRPRRFTEKMQWRKLFDLSPIFAVLSDRIAVRDFIASRVGSEFLPSLLWVGDNVGEIPFDALEPPYVLKCSHGSGWNVLVTNREDLDIRKTRELLSQGLSMNYGLTHREPGYSPVRARLLAERMLRQPDGSAPLEHKFYMFDGRVRLIWTIVVDRNRSRFDAVYDLDWNWLGWRAANQRHEQPLPRPERLKELIALAERVGAGFDHVRVDTYDVADGIRFGELTPYSYSGMRPFVPDEADFVLGSWWRLRHPIVRAAASLRRLKLRTVTSSVIRRATS
jgi:hypothetical protein